MSSSGTAAAQIIKSIIKSLWATFLFSNVLIKEYFIHKPRIYL